MIAPHKPPACGPPTDEIPAFRAAIVKWFQETGKSYPWRETEDPYAILVSELMLQQTQVATVLGKGYFQGWMDQFPDVHALAAASEAQILKAWEGLGYYRRARNLQKAAVAVVEEYGGVFPQTWEEIRALPGVGDYTAGAVVSFALNQPAAVVDANIARVLSRLFDDREMIESTRGKRQLQAWSLALVDPEEPRLFQSGLMELGQRICSPRTPDCETCPVSRWCITREPETLPVRKARASTEEVEEHVAWIRNGEGRVYLEQEAEGKRREGLWRLPLLAQPEKHPTILRTTYGITRYRVTMLVHEAAETDCAGTGSWFSETEIVSIAMASPYRKALEKLLEPDLFSG